MRDVKNFFKPSDFAEPCDGDCDREHEVIESDKELADKCNALLREYVESCPRVWINKNASATVWVENGGNKFSTHTARLIAIEPIAGGEGKE